ncbi:hypothetical protein IQ260_19225 [Leptolyngbya cf. ectocarpi LEGE 11479]|uniref:Contractile injection system tube protein N-terminal domain-containing protein n=1 Tax=Leptolyngbya cf. ectocarpi LEGE 11479 TaxID=1828722 RepID=A0A929F7J4_LEPEC|nr:hypothetical protein [Leptolyngbya ectocarpi]MBE9068780.1 hypothetical protein [Leptolyngbya cf. ectocarpi LEGE 11479]
MAETTLTKAKLKPLQGEKANEIVFMFNPKELSFSNQVQTTDNPGSRVAKSGRPHVSFSDIPPKQLIIKDIWFDTYETGKDVLKDYLQPFIESVNFDGEKQRPPIYRFTWGPHDYLKSCFIEQLNYRLTKFMPDGTPVRAVIETLGLKEIEKPSESKSATKSQQDSGDTRESRSKP